MVIGWEVCGCYKARGVRARGKDRRSRSVRLGWVIGYAGAEEQQQRAFIHLGLTTDVDGGHLRGQAWARGTLNLRPLLPDANCDGCVTFLAIGSFPPPAQLQFVVPKPSTQGAAELEQ